MYNPKSMKAEEFICHEEIMETLAYAEANKSNRELIESILEKAEKKEETPKEGLASIVETPALKEDKKPEEQAEEQAEENSEDKEKETENKD